MIFIDSPRMSELFSSLITVIGCLHSMTSSVLILAPKSNMFPGIISGSEKIQPVSASIRS